MTFPMQLDYFGIVAWMDTVNSLIWQSSTTDTNPICKRGKWLFFFLAIKLFLLTRENLKNIGECKEEGTPHDLST